jgi:5-histidylcysteine sulfoxide synthase
MPVTITRNPNLLRPQKPVFFENEVQKKFLEKKISWFTGLRPENCPGFDKERNCLVALPLLNLEICTRQDVLDSFNNVWTITELLFQSLKTEETFIRPPYHGLRHPMMFYYGHPAVLYYNKMRIAQFFDRPINLYLEKVLETGVDEMSWDDMSKNENQWPSVFEVHSYRKTVYDLIVNLIQTHPDLDLPIGERNFLLDSPWWSLWMGMEHEKIHIETSSVLIRELPIELVERPKNFPPLHESKSDSSALLNSWLSGHGGEVTIGKPSNEPSYGWDNAYGKRNLKIKDFKYSEFQITNREFFEFVKTGSYSKDEYWSAEGLQFRKFRNSKRPTFWCSVGPEGGHEYELRTLFEIIPMAWNFPVEVNFHEAQAYIRWKNKLDESKFHYRLMTEAEFISLRKNEADPVLQNKTFRQYKKFNEEFDLNFNLQWSGPKKVDRALYGNVWHWVLDQFNPLEDFKVHPYYDDFSTPCFDGKHQMILGGSFISCGEEASHFSRFHFRPHFYQHSGFRMAYSVDGSDDNGAAKIHMAKEYIHPRRMNVLDQMNQNEWWKNINQPLEMTEEEIKNLFDLTISKLVHYNRDFKKCSPMGNAHDAKKNKLKIDFSLPYIQTKNFPENAESLETLLNIVFDDLVPSAQKPGHSRFAAYVAGSGNAISNIGQLISMTLNPFSGHFMMAPGLVTIEEEAKKWFLRLFNFNEITSGAIFTSGSSQAMLQAISMARQNKLKGFDLSKCTAYISNDGHHSFAKNWVILGFNIKNLRLIPTKNFKMDVELLNKSIENDLQQNLIPLIITSTLGATKTGAVDKISDINIISKKFNLWHHIDGAYGAAFILTEKGKNLFTGIEDADSLNLDLHKSFSLPYGTGMLIAKNIVHMMFSYDVDESYMPPKPQEYTDISDISLELSRDFRGLRVWLPLKMLGVGPFILNLEEKIQLSEFANSELKKMKNIIVESDPELSIQTFSHLKGDSATKDLLAKINESEKLFLSGACLNNKFVIRLCLLSHQLHFEELKNGLFEILKISESI